MPGAPPPAVARAWAFLGVRPSETRVAMLMMGHSFFMGCATVFFETAASATFLARYPASSLPWVYIAAAGVNTLTGAVYARAQTSISFGGLMKGTLWFLLATMLAVRAGLAASGVAWIAFAGLVSYRVISSLTDLEYWAVASRIYDVRQAKRLFGLIGTGEVVARIAGAFCVPLLVRTGGVGNLMLLSAAALVGCLVILGRILRRAAPPLRASLAPPESLEPMRSVRADLREIVTSRYLLVVVGVAVLATFGKYFVDFAFLEQVSTLSRGETELATILGLFSGLTQTLSLLTRIFLSRPLITRLGIRVAIMILPLAHLLCSLLVIGAGLAGYPMLVFWFVIANQGIYKTLKHPIDNASFKVLYQPLKSRQRLAVQIAVEIIFSPVVVGLSGVVMLLFSAGLHYDPVHFAFVLAIVFLAWAIVARRAGRRYAAKLLDMLPPHADEDADIIAASPSLRDMAPAGASAEQVRALLRVEAGHLASLLACSNTPEVEIAEARKRIMQLLARLHDRIAVQRIERHLTHLSNEKRAYAHELLELLLDRDERRLLMPLLTGVGSS